jgi:hypothetical protein
MMVSPAVINTVNGPLSTVKLKKGGAAGGGVWVVFKLAELDAMEDVEVALDCEVVLLVEVLGDVLALVALVVEDFCPPFGTENPTTPPMTMTTMTIIANAVVLRPGRPFLGVTILPPRLTALPLLTVTSAPGRLSTAGNATTAGGCT